MVGGRRRLAVRPDRSGGDCAGIPTLAEQERRDGVPRRLYQRLVDGGALRVAEGLHVPTAGMMAELVRSRWQPRAMVADRRRIQELWDAKLPVEPRVTRWFEGSADIRALRKLARDGPLSVVPEACDLLEASLAVATVKDDGEGNMRLIKRGSNNQSRDDVAAAWTLAVGVVSRLPPTRRVYHGIV